MIELLSPIKGYLTAGLAVVVAVFVAIFKYRGTKIVSLEKEISIKEREAIVAEKVTKANKESAQYVADNRVAKVEAEDEVEEDNHKYTPDTKFYI